MTPKQVSELTPNPRNPRKITDERLDAFKRSIAQFGDISGIVYNVRSKSLMGGNQRGKVLSPEAEIVIEKSYDPPTPSGTVSVGYVLDQGERFNYRQVDWDEPHEKLAMIAANRGAGDWNFELLIDQLNELDAGNYDLDLTLFDMAERDRLMGGWDDGDDALKDIPENLDGITATIKIKCPQDLKDEVLIYLKAKLLETSFEGVEVV